MQCAHHPGEGGSIESADGNDVVSLGGVAAVEASDDGTKLFVGGTFNAVNGDPKSMVIAHIWTVYARTSK